MHGRIWLGTVRDLFALFGQDLVDCIGEDVYIVLGIVGNGLDELQVLFVSNGFFVL